MTIDALVGETHTRSALAGLRGLARGGYKVIAVGPGRAAAGLWSRHASVSSVAPSVLTDPAGYVERLGRLGVEHGPLVAYPVQEEGIDALYDAGSRLPSQVRLPYPDAATVRRLRDKPELPGLAAAAGFASARTLAHATAAELADDEELPFPCVVKPFGKGGAIGTTRRVDSRGELRALLRRLPPEEPLLLQERLLGEPMAVALVVDREGRATARFQQRSLRTWPSGAGSSSLAVGVAPDEDLIARAANLLHLAGYHGLAQLQFMRRDDTPVLIDINPRFYGSLPLALASGVNLAADWHAVVTGERPRSAQPYRIGVTFRWLEADVLAALRGSPSRLLWRAPAPRVGAIWARDDPVAGAVYGVQILNKRIRSRLPRLT